MYFGEVDMLMFRLYVLGPYVDYFILGVSNIAHSKNSMDLKYSFSPYDFEIMPYLHKIKFSYSNFTGHEDSNPWYFEKQQRQDMMRVISKLNPQPDDLIIQADIDEIPTPAAMRYIINNPPEKYYYLECMFFSYSFRWQNEELWLMNSVFKYGTANLNLNFYRNGPNNNILPGYSCVHCSFCFNSVQRYIKKAENTAHQEFARPPFTEEEYVYSRIKGRCGYFRNTAHIVFAFEKFPPFKEPMNPKLKFLFDYQPIPIPQNIYQNKKFSSYLRDCQRKRFSHYPLQSFQNQPELNELHPFGPYWN